MSKQLKSLDNRFKTSKGEQTKTITFNLAHLLFLHGLLSKFPKDEKVDKNMRRFIHDLTFLFEIYIDGIDDDETKNKFNYKTQ